MEWIRNKANWAKLLAGALVVALNYAFHWGWDPAALATLGALLAIPIELWDLIVSGASFIYKLVVFLVELASSKARKD